MANTVLQIVPSKTVVKPGGSFTVAIIVAPASGVNIAGVQANLGFNPQALQVNSITEELLKSGTITTYFMPGTIDNVSGTV